MRLTGQVPPSMILSNARALGIPADMPERPDRTDPLLFSLDSRDASDEVDVSLSRRPCGCSTYAGRRYASDSRGMVKMLSGRISEEVRTTTSRNYYCRSVALEWEGMVRLQECVRQSNPDVLECKEAD